MKRDVYNEDWIERKEGKTRTHKKEDSSSIDHEKKSEERKHDRRRFLISSLLRGDGRAIATPAMEEVRKKTLVFFSFFSILDRKERKTQETKRS